MDLSFSFIPFIVKILPFALRLVSGKVRLVLHEPVELKTLLNFSRRTSIPVLKIEQEGWIE